MKHAVFTLLALCALLPLNAAPVSTGPGNHAIVLHDPADSNKAAAMRIMKVLLDDGVVTSDHASELRAEIMTILDKTPLASTGDAKQDAAAREKVKQQVQHAVLKRVGKDKSTRVAELLAKAECWEAKACAKGKSCCSGH